MNKRAIQIVLFIFILIVFILSLKESNQYEEISKKHTPDGDIIVKVTTNPFKAFIKDTNIYKNKELQDETLVNHINKNNKKSHNDILKDLKKQYNTLKAIFNNNHNPNITDSYEFHILWYAIMFSDKDMVRKLIRDGLFLDGEIGNKAIFLTIGNNIFTSADDNQKKIALKNTRIFEMLLENGIDISDKAFYKDKMLETHTPLTLSVRFDNKKAIETLLEHGVNINGKTKYGKTALMESLEQNNKDIIKFLLENNSDKEKIQDNGRSVYMYAIESGDLDTIKMIDPKMENTIDIVSPMNTNALMMVSRKGNKEEIQYYLDRGLDIESMDDRGYTPLFEATRSSNFEAVKYLIEKGARTNLIEAKTHKNLLQVAAAGGFWSLPESRRPKVSYEMMDYIYNNGDYDINSIGNIGSTALIGAAGSNNMAAVKFLLDKGSDREIVNKRGYTALTAAEYYGYAEIIDLLKNYKVKR